MRRRVIHAEMTGMAAGILTACALVSGCGPIEYIATVPLDAAGAYGEAKHINSAEKYAPYEMTAAREYLHKSRELAGYARFHSSVTFGQKAADYANKAKQLAANKAALPEAHDGAHDAAPETSGAPATTPSGDVPVPQVRDATPASEPTRVIIIPQPENQ